MNQSCLNVSMHTSGIHCENRAMEVVRCSKRFQIANWKQKMAAESSKFLHANMKVRHQTQNQLRVVRDEKMFLIDQILLINECTCKRSGTELSCPAARVKNLPWLVSFLVWGNEDENDQGVLHWAVWHPRMAGLEHPFFFLHQTHVVIQELEIVIEEKQTDWRHVWFTQTSTDEQVLMG